MKPTAPYPFAADIDPENLVTVTAGTTRLEGNLVVPVGAHGIVLFAHGSGSSRHSPRNRYVASVLQRAGLATLLFDLLTPDEEDLDCRTRQLRFNINLLSDRLIGATDWVCHTPTTQFLKVGYFGASTGSAAALMAAAQRPHVVQAIVSRGGRPDLAGTSIAQVTAPILLLVGGEDFPCIGMNEDALAQLEQARSKQLVIIPNATHLFAETGTLEQVAAYASQWFRRYLRDYPEMV